MSAAMFEFEEKHPTDEFLIKLGVRGVLGVKLSSDEDLPDDPLRANSCSRGMLRFSWETFSVEREFLVDILTLKEKQQNI